jgi:hypothetical protein
LTRGGEQASCKCRRRKIIARCVVGVLFFDLYISVSENSFISTQEELRKHSFTFSMLFLGIWMGFDRTSF